MVKIESTLLPVDLTEFRAHVEKLPFGKRLPNALYVLLDGASFGQPLDGLIEQLVVKGVSKGSGLPFGHFSTSTIERIAIVVGDRPFGYFSRQSAAVRLPEN